MDTRQSGKKGGLVYSTDHGKMCPGCSQPEANCVCEQQAIPTCKDSMVRVGRETKGRKGAGVTVITGLPMNVTQLSELCTQLKKKCGCGGTVKDGVIEIQGDRRDTLVEELVRLGYKAKRIGG